MLWAITSYFNPIGYRRRLENFWEFRRRLAVSLLAVELGYGDRFELADDDADILVRLRGRDVLWQKERLLNVALGRLPDECTVVASVDCDVIFEREDRGAATTALLERFSAVQLFTRVHHLRREWGSERPPRDAVIFAQEASANAVARGSDPMTVLSTPSERRPGITVNGFGWAFAGRVGCLEGDVFYLWHGRTEDRQTRQRHLDLRPFRFDPRQDITQDDAGCWRWCSDKPDLHACVRQYFAARREDG